MSLELKVYLNYSSQLLYFLEDYVPRRGGGQRRHDLLIIHSSFQLIFFVWVTPKWSTFRNTIFYVIWFLFFILLWVLISTLCSVILFTVSFLILSCDIVKFPITPIGLVLSKIHNWWAYIAWFSKITLLLRPAP